MSLFDDCNSSDSENDADYAPEYSSEDSLPSDLIENESKNRKRNQNKIAESEKPEKEIKVADKKKIDADDLFKSFLSDCENEMKAKEQESGIFKERESSTVSNSEANNESSYTLSSSSKISEIKNSPVVSEKESFDGKSTIEVFDFAGETVCVSKDGNSVSVLNQPDDSDKRDQGPSGKEVKRKAGLSSVLGLIQNKKPKLSTLDKTLLDWKTFKQNEGIEEDLRKHNLGKAGFIERQRFLQRSDQRAFEIERDMRLSKKKK